MTTNLDTSEAPEFRKLGRLASLGPKEPWQVALLLPEYHDDLTALISDVRDLEERHAKPIQFTVLSPPRATFSRSGVPRVLLEVRDGVGQDYRATIFGDTKQWLERLKGQEVIVTMATAKWWNDELYVTIEELVEPEWIGRHRPHYPGRRQVITPETARKTVTRLLPKAIPQAAAFLKEQFKPFASSDIVLADLGARGWTLEQVLEQAHLPATAAYGEHAQKVCRRLAAIGALLRMHGQGTKKVANPLDMSAVDKRMAQMPFALTNDQVGAIRELAERMAGEKPLHAIISGDVGTGKTAVAAVLAAAVTQTPGRRVVVMSPNTLLAEQIFAEFQKFFPDLSIWLVTGNTPTATDLSASILVGTSALLHRPTSSVPFDLVIVDEQHRWSRAQREQLVSSNSHLIELSATLIPRTQALVRYGHVHVIEMRQTARPKTFITTLYQGKQGSRELFEAIGPGIRSGDPLLVVYPKREASDDPGAVPPGGISDRHSIELARQRWEEFFPGKVVTLTSDDDDAAKADAIQKITKRQAQVLLCTTVVEVGINLPNLYRIVIVCPERHGLMALHQLRGRTARHGGEGYCELLCPEPLNPDQREKLQAFCTLTDGFALAEYDLRRRGAGDLSPDSEQQSGADNTFLFGSKIDIDMLDEVLPVWQRWTEGQAGNGAGK